MFMSVIYSGFTLIMLYLNVFLIDQQCLALTILRHFATIRLAYLSYREIVNRFLRVALYIHETIIEVLRSLPCASVFGVCMCDNGCVNMVKNALCRGLYRISTSKLHAFVSRTSMYISVNLSTYFCHGEEEKTTSMIHTLSSEREVERL